MDTKETNQSDTSTEEAPSAKEQASEKERAEQQAKKKKPKKKKKLGSRKRGISDMFRTSYRLHVDLSSIADNKSNIMISINGIIISIIIASISPKIDANPWLLVPTAVLLVTCLISMVYAIRAARPRVSSDPVTLEDVQMNKANIMFFGHFVNMSEEEYVQGMTEIMRDQQRLYYNMIRDLYGLGQVLARKFKLLRIAYTVFMIGLVLAVLLFIGVFVDVVHVPGVDPNALP